MKYNNLTELFTAIADSIRGKTGGSDKIPAENFPEAIDGIQVGGGGSSVSPKDVNFYDYDGTLLHAYTLEEAQALTELPELPTQEGLICQGWNWTLEDIKAHNRAVDVGATYITDDGKTRLYISIETEEWKQVSFNCSFTNYGGSYRNIIIDWGDGTAPVAGNTTSHTYDSVGDYVVTIELINGCTMSPGRSGTTHGIMSGGTGTTPDAKPHMLKKVELGNGVIAFNDGAFNQCHALKSITIPNGLTNIPESTFDSCYSLSHVTIPNGVTSISKSAFSGSLIESVSIPNGVTSIGTYAFRYCHALQSATIPNGVTSIGTYAFQDCHSLQSATIPNSVTSIGTYAFEKCYSLSGVVVIPNGVTSIGNNTFNYCYSISEVVISDGVKSLGNYAFSNCKSLQRITIPNSVTSIGSYAFIEDRMLLEITIPDSVTAINAYTFNYCSTVTRFAIPSGVTTIKDSAFAYCDSAKFYDFTSHTQVPTLANTWTFSQNAKTAREFLVPAALYDEWIAATNWSSFADQIVAV